jgi:death-on-curing protein
LNEGQIRFLSLDNVLHIHDDTLREEGGSSGVRDWGLLESAVEMPQAMFDGEYLHRGPAAMAAAYLYHLCRNHAFIDGNKRTAALSAVLFLALNGVPDAVLPPEEGLEQVTLAVAAGHMTETEVADWFRGSGIGP